MKTYLQYFYIITVEKQNKKYYIFREITRIIIIFREIHFHDQKIFFS